LKRFKRVSINFGIHNTLRVAGLEGLSGVSRYSLSSRLLGFALALAVLAGVPRAFAIPASFVKPGDYFAYTVSISLSLEAVHPRAGTGDLTETPVKCQVVFTLNISVAELSGARADLEARLGGFTLGFCNLTELKTGLSSLEAVAVRETVDLNSVLDSSTLTGEFRGVIAERASTGNPLLFITGVATYLARISLSNRDSYAKVEGYDLISGTVTPPGGVAVKYEGFLTVSSTYAFGVLKTLDLDLDLDLKTERFSRKLVVSLWAGLESSSLARAPLLSAKLSLTAFTLLAGLAIAAAFYTAYRRAVYAVPSSKAAKEYPPPPPPPPESATPTHSKPRRKREKQ